MRTHLRCLFLAVFFGPSLNPVRAELPRAETLIERQRKEKAPVWIDGDKVTFFYRGEADKVELLFGGFLTALERIPGSDVWTFSASKPQLERAVFSYHLTPRAKDPAVKKSGYAEGIWRGPRSPAPAVECATLKGTRRTWEVPSKALGGQRKATVYLPPGHDVKKATPVLYAADGQSIERFAHVLEPLITAAKIPPVVLVGVHSGGYLGDLPGLDNYDPKKDLRAQEYFPGLDAQRFADHETFFCTEVPAWAEKRFGVSSARQDRLVFGYSNGGRFAVEMGLRHPDRFGHILGFSVAGNGKFDFGTERKEWPRFYLAAGTWEESFHHCTSCLAEELKKRKIAVRFSSRVGGHDPALWRDEFAAALLGVWGKS